MAMYEPEWLCQRIVEDAPDAIILADRDGIIRLWNGGAEAVFGYTAEDALGQSLDLIVPERFRERHWAGFRRAMETGVSRYGRELLAVPAIRKDATRISIEFSVAVLRDPGGQSSWQPGGLTATRSKAPPDRSFLPPELKLAGGFRFIETAHRSSVGRLMEQVGLVAGLPRNLKHRLGERFQGLLRFGLGRLDHHGR